MKLLSLGRRTATGPDLSEHQQRLVWRVTALLLDYPTAETSALTDELAAAAGELPEPIRTHVTDFLRYFCETDATERATRYVETFDMRRRASLHLTYYAYGDTRKRGMARLSAQQVKLRALDLRLRAAVEETQQLVELGGVLARSAKIEAAYGGGFSPALMQVSTDFAEVIAQIKRSLEVLGKERLVKD